MVAKVRGEEKWRRKGKKILGEGKYLVCRGEYERRRKKGKYLEKEIFGYLKKNLETNDTGTIWEKTSFSVVKKERKHRVHR